MTNDLTVRVSTDHEHDEHAETRTLLVVDAEPDDPLLAVSVTFAAGRVEPGRCRAQPTQPGQPPM